MEPLTYRLETYFRDQGSNLYGKCKVCGISVFWPKQKQESHNRGGSCRGQPPEEMDFFKSSAVISVSTSEPPIPKKGEIQATDEELVNVKRVDMWVDSYSLTERKVRYAFR